MDKHRHSNDTFTAFSAAKLGLQSVNLITTTAIKLKITQFNNLSLPRLLLVSLKKASRV